MTEGPDEDVVDPPPPPPPQAAKNNTQVNRINVLWIIVNCFVTNRRRVFETELNLKSKGSFNLELHFNKLII